MHKTNPTERVVQIACLCLTLLAGGCASIVHNGNRTVTIGTEPSGAKATVTKATGESVTVQTTPCTVSLDPKRGYFKGQDYHLKLELAGYHTTEVALTPTLSGWYFGNILIGGLIGMVVVDPLTGSMWNIEPKNIQQKLSPAQASMIKNQSGFVVVLVSDVTEAERKSMTKLN
jgi:hypothetical protein